MSELQLSSSQLVFFAVVYFSHGPNDEGEQTQQMEPSGPFDYDTAQEFAVQMAGNPRTERVEILNLQELSDVLKETENE